MVGRSGNAPHPPKFYIYLVYDISPDPIPPYLLGEVPSIHILGSSRYKKMGRTFVCMCVPALICGSSVGVPVHT